MSDIDDYKDEVFDLRSSDGWNEDEMRRATNLRTGTAGQAGEGG